MKIKDLEEQLFSKWQESRDRFVRDGVVFEPIYLKSNPKIVFILKEVNAPDKEGWDLREFLAKGGRRQTWDNISRWVHGIRHRKSIPNWSFYSKITEEFRREILRSICVINLKKSPGLHTTEKASLYAIAIEDKGYIQRQYEIYDPDITICAGTGGLFKMLVEQDSIKWKTTTRGIRWYERDVNKYVISFSHPEARVHNPLLMYSLLDAINEVYA